MKILFRVLGGRNIGYGHFYRCMSLAKAFLLCKEDIEIRFLINDDLTEAMTRSNFKYIVNNCLHKDIHIISEEKADYVVIDTYLGNDDYLRDISKVSPIILIDDNNDIYETRLCHFVINGSVYAKELDYPDSEDTQYLLGKDYLILRDEYWDLEDKIKSNGLQEDILITTGSTDKYGISIRVMETLRDIDTPKTVIIGPAYDDELIRQIKEIEGYKLEICPDSLAKAISDARIVITACGTTVYEVLAMGRYPIIFSHADNQDRGCIALERAGVDYIGKYPNIDYDYLLDRINMIHHRNLILDEATVMDFNGRGAINIANRILGG